MDELVLNLGSKKKDTRNFIFKEAFKLFLVKNFEKVTLADIEDKTNFCRGTILYHAKNKENLFINVVNEFFFSALNLYHPIPFTEAQSVKEYIELKGKHLSSIDLWFNNEKILVNPSYAFFNVLSQASQYYPEFTKKMSALLKEDFDNWVKIIELGVSIKELHPNINPQKIVHVFQKMFVGVYSGKSLEFNGTLTDHLESFEILYEVLKLQEE